MARSPRGYDVFLSYASVDEPQARALERGLQRFAKPWYRLQALRVFRDRSVLPAGDGLWSALRSRLQAARWLVLLASPESAKSEWVEREVSWWREHHSVNGTVTNIIVVRTDGTADDLPPALGGAFAEEQLWAPLPRMAADATPYPELLAAALHRFGAVTALRLRGHFDADQVRHLRDCIASTGAAAHGMSRDELDGDHLRQRRRTRLTAAVAVCALAVAATGAAVYRGQADAQHRSAIAAELVRRAVAVRDADPRLALQLGLAADTVHPGADTRAGLVDTLTASRYRGVVDGEGVAFAPGRPIVAAVANGVITLWDIGRPGPPQLLGTAASTDRNSRATLAFSPDGHLIATATSSGAVLLSDVTDPQRPRQLGSTAPTREAVSQPVGMAFTPDGAHLVVTTATAVPAIWDVRRADHPVRVATLPGPVQGRQLLEDAAVAVSADGRTVAVADDLDVRLWDIATPAAPTPLGPPLSGHTGAVSGLAFSARGVLAVSSFDQTTTLWAVTDPAQPALVGTATGGHSQGVSSVALMPDGITMITGGVDGKTVRWDVSDPARPRALGVPLVGRTEAVRTVAVSGDGRLFASSGDEGTSLLWASDDPAEPHYVNPPALIPGPQANVRPAVADALDPDGHTGAFLAQQQVTLVDLADLSRPRRIGAPLPDTTDVVDLAFAPVGHVLATAGDDITLWDTADPAEPRPLGHLVETPADGLTAGASAVAFSPDGRLLAAAFDDERVQLWDVSRPDAARGLGSPMKIATTELAFSPDGKTLALGGLGSATSLYDISDPAFPRPLGEPLRGQPEYRGFVDSLAYSPDGDLLATSSGNETAIVWSVSNPAAPTRMGPPLDATTDAATTAVVFSRDGTLLITQNVDGDPVVRDLTDPSAPLPLGRVPHGEPLVPGTLRPFPDGHTVLAANADGAPVILDLAGLLDLRAHGHKRACQLLGAGFDRMTWARYVPDVDYADSC